MSFLQNSMNYQHSFMLYAFEPFIRFNISKYDTVYFVGDNEAINRVRVDSSKTRNRGAFSGSLAALPTIPSDPLKVAKFFKIKTKAAMSG